MIIVLPMMGIEQALVRERVEDWGKGLCRVLNKKLVELTGDYTPDIRHASSSCFCVNGILQTSHE